MGEVYNEKPSSMEPAPVTWSNSVTETEDGAHEFTIAGYSLLKGMGFAKHVSSSVFTVGKHDWAIYFYPDGKNEEDGAEYVSLFIALASVATDVRAVFELKLMDQSGKGEHRIHSNFGRSEKEPHLLKHLGSMWGYKKFLRRSQLEGSDYLRGDCLLVHCRVGVVQTRIVVPKTYSVVVPPSDMGQHFGKLLESGKNTDVTFVVKDEVFPAHKLVLAARSPVFMAQFFGPMKDEAISSIDVDDMDASAFRALLHYMYWDTLPAASTLMAQHLLAAADKYGLDRLRLLCESKLCENIAINNVATSLALAEQHQCLPLKSVCLEFAAMPENRKAVVQTDGYKYLKESCPSVIHELLEYAARMTELSLRTGCEMDGSDVNGRRVKQRLR